MPNRNESSLSRPFATVSACALLAGLMSTALVWMLPSVRPSVAAPLAAPTKSGATTAPTAPLAYAAAKQIATLRDRAVTESSGLACSRRSKGVLWTHNDSGDKARLFATDETGENLATLTVTGVVARDWEDMCSVRLGGRSWLFVADTGNNLNVPYPLQIVVVEEPKLNPARRGVTIKQAFSQIILARFADGWLDCESLAVDPVGRRIYMVTKRRKKDQVSKVYELPLPVKPVRAVHVARPIATLHTDRMKIITDATAMDISPDGLRAVVLTYGHAWEYVRGAKEGWSDAFARPGRQITMPRRRQGEAICFGWDGRILLTTSEGGPCPLWRIAVQEGKGR